MPLEHMAHSSPKPRQGQELAAPCSTFNGSMASTASSTLRSSLVHGHQAMVLQVAACIERCRLSITLEAVHELRVIIRRTEPYHRVLRYAGWEPGRMAGEKRLFARVMDLTGPLRDAQTRHQRLIAAPGRKGRLHMALAAASERELGRLEGRVQRGLRELPPALVRLMGANAKAPRGARKALERALAHLRERLKAHIAGLEDGDARALHNARIAVKRYRYLLEAFAPHLGSDELTALSACVRLQSRLGRWHDERVLLEWVERRMRSLPRSMEREGHTLFEAGRALCSDEERKLLRALRRWRP